MGKKLGNHLHLDPQDSAYHLGTFQMSRLRLDMGYAVAQDDRIILQAVEQYQYQMSIRLSTPPVQPGTVPTY